MVNTNGFESISNGSIRGNLIFRRLSAASSISALGSHVTTIAYPLLVLRLTGSPFTTGCAVFAATAPGILAYIPAGALVDRWNPMRVMLLSEIGRGVAIGSVAATLALGKPPVGILMAVSAAEGILETFSQLAERSYIGLIVERDQVNSALVRTEARTHLVLVAGRPLGVLLFGLRPIFPFLADVVSFAYTVSVLFRTRDSLSLRKAADSQNDWPPSKASLANDIGQGVLWMRGNNFARIATLSFSIGTLSFQALLIIFLSEAHSQRLSALSIGMTVGASGIGGAFGSLMAARPLPKTRYTWMQIQSVTWFAGFALLIPLIGHWFLFTAIIMAILGMTGAIGNVQLDTHLMLNVDRVMQARVNSVVRLTSLAAAAIGPVVGGVLFEEFGARRAMSSLWILTSAPLAISIFMALASLRDRRATILQRSKAIETYARGNYGRETGI